MKWKNRLTNYNFWISIVSAVLLILQAFNFEFDIAYISEIATAVLGLLVVIGIISDPTRTYTPSETNKQPVEENSTSDEKEVQTPEEAIKEEQAESSTTTANVKNENDFICSESNFQTVIEFISKEINKTVGEVLNNKTEPNEKETETNNSEPQETVNCYNIVN